MVSVAVFLNSEGFTALPEEEGTVEVYAREASVSWEIIGEHAFSILGSRSISELRKTILSMVQEIGDCKTFVGRKVTGQLYNVLEANGFTIYEVEGKPERFLNMIPASGAEIDRSPVEKTRTAIVTGPEKTGAEGSYFMDLKTALNSDPNLTSKKALLPFLAEGKFKVLEVVCDHVPRWFEAEFEKLGLGSTVKEIDKNEFTVIIYARP